MAELTPPAQVKKPVPAAQAVSIHGDSTIHKTHWAFIAAILGVFLVLETIFLVYTYMKQSTEASQQIVEQIQDQAAIDQEQLAEDTSTEIGFTEGDVFSHLKFNPEMRLIADEQDRTATYLRSQIEAASANSPCTDTYSVVDQSMRWQGGVDAVGLTDPAVDALFSTRVSATGKTRVASLIDAYDSSLAKVCTGEQSDYLVLLNGNYTMARVAMYDQVREYWNVFPAFDVMDGAISVLPDFFKDKDNAPLIMTGYGDAGVFWWQYWTPLFGTVPQLIEDCTTDMYFVTENGVETPQGRKLTCKLEYIE